MGDNIKMDFREMVKGHGLDRSGSGQGEVAGIWECCNEIWVQKMRGGGFLDQLRTG